ncbi:hypothetical protein Tco_1165757, partial [Tanacetum coccineum]
MYDPNITIEEYIQVEAEKALRRGQEFNWEIATYGTVRYFEDIDYFKDFENEFPAIVYKYAKSFDFVISFDESDGEDNTFTYDKNSFSYKLFFVNDLKSDSDNDD